MAAQYWWNAIKWNGEIDEYTPEEARLVMQSKAASKPVLIPRLKAMIDGKVYERVEESIRLYRGVSASVQELMASVDLPEAPKAVTGPFTQPGGVVVRLVKRAVRPNQLNRSFFEGPGYHQLYWSDDRALCTIVFAYPGRMGEQLPDGVEELQEWERRLAEQRLGDRIHWLVRKEEVVNAG